MDPLESLRTFALESLAAEKYPGAYHRFRTPACPACGTLPLEVTVEWHSGSSLVNFRGVIHGRCARCGSETDVFRFTGPQRELVEQEQLCCSCEGTEFWLTICERIEGEDGLPGFFDEGVVAGQCAVCGQRLIVAAYD